jgi:hypothetical protein
MFLLGLLHAARNFAFASSSVAAWPRVALDAGTTSVLDQNQRSSGGILSRARHGSRRRGTTVAGTAHRACSSPGPIDPIACGFPHSGNFSAMIW